MAKDRIYETEDGIRIAPLSALDDFEVAEGYPDIRDWRVTSADGKEVGQVHDLLIDVDHMRTRYIDVRLTKELASSPSDRDVLVPVGTAELVEGKDLVRVPLTAERFGLLPIYEHRLTRTHELEVRRHFSLGEAAAAAVTGTTAAAATGNFYDDEGYDDRRFFGKRRPTPAAEELLAARRVDAERADAARVDIEEDVRTRESEIRVPVERDDAVVLKRGDDGRDEIIIRRPIGEKRVEP